MNSPVPGASAVKEQLYASKTLGRIFLGLLILQAPAYLTAIVFDVDQRLAYGLWLFIGIIQHVSAYYISEKVSIKAATAYYIGVTHLVFPFFSLSGIVNDPITLVYFIIPVSLSGFVFGARNMLVHSLLLLPYFLLSTRGHLKSESVIAVFIAIFICSWLTMTMFRYWERIGQIRREGLKQANLHLTRANRSKAVLLENMSHEVLTPMTSILGFSELLKAEARDEETVYALDMIIRSGNRLRTMLQSVLEVAHIEGGDLNIEGDAVSVEDVLITVVEILRTRAKEKGLMLESNFSQLPLLVTGSKSALSRVFYNVIENAIVYTKKGKVEVNTYLETKWVCIDVHDTGPGMSESFKKVAFEPFKQESEGVGRLYEGVGIGLTIAQQLVSLMNGHIFIDTVKGKGTQVTVKLPIYDEQMDDELPSSFLIDEGLGNLGVRSQEM